MVQKGWFERFEYHNRQPELTMLLSEYHIDQIERIAYVAG